MTPAQDSPLITKEDALEEMLYCSVAVPKLLKKFELNKILESARRRNLAAGITGMLIYYRGEFVQILEGSKQSIDDIYNNHIKTDSLHTDLNIVNRNSILNRSFDKWTMGFIDSEEIESKTPVTLNKLSMKMLTAEAQGKKISPGVGGFISIYNRMREIN